jgi:rhomboid protease GluP
VLTRLLIGACVLVYVWQMLHGNPENIYSLVRDGALYGPLVQQGEWWRFVTAAFLHAGLLHIASNMLALWQVGTVVEALYGRVRMALIYAISIAGSGFAVLWFSFNVPVVGASGAIFGLFGALAAAGLRLGKPGRTLVQASSGTIVLNLVLGFTIFRFVSNAAHIGGVVTGFLCGIALFRVPRMLAPAAVPVTPAAPAVAGGEAP